MSDGENKKVTNEEKKGANGRGERRQGKSGGGKGVMVTPKGCKKAALAKSLLFPFEIHRLNGGCRVLQDIWGHFLPDPFQDNKDLTLLLHLLRISHSKHYISKNLSFTI